jgi:aminomethyltransferase
VIERERFSEAWSALTAAGATPAGTDALDALRILRGLPRWPQDMPDRAFIHELGIRERVCNFNKGCYIGQEIINRMDTMGKVNKRLTALVSDDGAPGAEVLRGEKVVGVITSAARVDGRVVSIGVLRKEAGEPGDPVEIKIEGRVVPATISSLPVPAPAGQGA